MNLSYDVVEADFDSLVLARSHEVPVVLDIGAEWCSPCRVLTPLLERLVGGYEHARQGAVLAPAPAGQHA